MIKLVTIGFAFLALCGGVLDTYEETESPISIGDAPIRRRSVVKMK